MLCARLYLDNKGSIIAMAAALIGLVAAVVFGAVVHARLTESRKALQHAADTAALAVAKRINEGASREAARAAGEAAFRVSCPDDKCGAQASVTFAIREDGGVDAEAQAEPVVDFKPLERVFKSDFNAEAQVRMVFEVEADVHVAVDMGVPETPAEFNPAELMAIILRGAHYQHGPWDQVQDVFASLAGAMGATNSDAQAATYGFARDVVELAPLTQDLAGLQGDAHEVLHAALGLFGAVVIQGSDLTRAFARTAEFMEASAASGRPQRLVMLTYGYHQSGGVAVALDPADCDVAKAQGEVYVFKLEHPGDDPLGPDVEAALAACASNGRYYVADVSGAVDAALAEIAAEATVPGPRPALRR